MTPGYVLLLLLAASLVATGAKAGTANVVLNQPATTSAGIFDSDNRLVRTLWSARPEGRGTLSISWDGHDDEGREVPPGHSYHLKVLTQDIHYRWQGVIGNTSRS